MEAAAARWGSCVLPVDRCKGASSLFYHFSLSRASVVPENFLVVCTDEDEEEDEEVRR